VKIGIRLKLFLVSLAVIAVSFASADILLSSRLDAKLIVATTGALAVAVLIALLAAHWIARLVRSLTSAARRMARGDFAVRTRVGGTDEIAELGGALDQLAIGLSDAMTQLRSERDLLGGILDAMQEGVLVLDAEARIVRVNPALRSMLLLGRDAVGHPLLEVVRNAELKELVDQGRVGAASREIEISGLKPRVLLARASTLPADESRGAASMLVVCRDVTAVRRLETMRRDFVANVSHELRTPVTAVRSAAETLQAGGGEMPAESAQRFVDIIDRNAERLQGLIEDLLDLSRIESKEFRLSREPVVLRPFLGHSLSLFRDRAEKRGIRLRLEVAENTPPVYADRKALEQVVTNLTDNAVKYCPNCAITLGAHEDKGGVAITVKDGGPGIEEKHLPRLFERFYRVDAGRSREVGGTGLGLSIVKHLVEAMEGEVKVDSVVGRGTTFTVWLPLAVESSRMGPPVAPKESESESAAS